MRRTFLALLPILALAAGCTASNSYDLMETASTEAKASKPKIKTRYHDTDPQDFGRDSPIKRQIHGIDISKWNGEIEWNKVKRAGIEFAFIKATEGKDVVDPKFDDYWRGAARADVAHAPYHFYYFCSTPEEQAAWFIRNVPKSAMHLPPVLDAEWNHSSKTCKRHPEPEVVRTELKRFMDIVERHYGKRPIIYTTVDFHRDNLVGHFNNYHFWVRSVAAPPQDTYASRRWAFWQYTSTGVIPGIENETDINVFAGNKANWLNWVATVR